MTPDLAEDATVPARARPLLAPASAAYVAALLGIGVIIVGGIGIRDGVLAAGWITGASWTGAVAGWIDGLAFAGWMYVAGAATAILGAIVVVLAVKPRRRTSAELSGRSSVAIAHSDVARVAASAARAIPGVIDARARSTHRKLTVTARTTMGPDGSAVVKTAVAEAVGAALAALSSPPSISVRTRSGGPE